MNVRRSTIALLLVAPLVLALSGCGGDDDATDTSQQATTTAAPGSSTVEMTTTTLSDDEFTAQLAEVGAALDAAGDDFCKIAEAANQLNLGMPANPTQAKAAYETFSKVLNRLADHLPEGSAADPAVLRNAASAVVAEGEASNFDPSKFEGVPKAFGDPATMQSMSAVSSDIGTVCRGGGVATTTPAG